MGKRNQSRKQTELPVRIFGTDSHGQIFSEKVVAVNVSRSGAELSGIHAELVVDEVIGISYGTNRAHFRVKWIGKAGTSKAGHAGVQNVSPEKTLWDFVLPADAVDEYQPGSVEIRQNTRFRCQSSIEIHVEGGASFWATVADLSLGGCYVEMSIPLAEGTKVKVGIWFGQSKVLAEAVVTHRTPGMGIGLQFVEITDQDRDQIRRFLEGLAPFARKATRAKVPQGNS